MEEFGGVAEWLGSGLQSRVRRFESGPRLRSTRGRALTGPPRVPTKLLLASTPEWAYARGTFVSFRAIGAVG